MMAATYARRLVIGLLAVVVLATPAFGAGDPTVLTVGMGSEIRILKRTRSKAGEATRVFANYRRDMVVQDPAKIEAIGRFRPITKHDRHCGKHLD